MGPRWRDSEAENQAKVENAVAAVAALAVAEKALAAAETVLAAVVWAESAVAIESAVAAEAGPKTSYSHSAKQRDPASFLRQVLSTGHCQADQSAPAKVTKLLKKYRQQNH